MNTKELQHEKLFKKVNFYLTMSGAYIDKEDINRSTLQRFLSRPFYCFNLVFILSHVAGEISWGVEGFSTKSASFMQLTYLIPGITLCCVGFLKSYYLVQNGDLVFDLNTSLNKMQEDSAKTEQSVEIKIETKKRTSFLSTILIANNGIYLSGFLLFSMGPLIITWLKYKSTGNLVMQLPFFSYFPFDETDLRFWPIAYFHQVWTTVITILTVHGPDSFYSYSCTFLLIQFKTLHYDIGQICPENEDFTQKEKQEKFKQSLREITTRHNELIRCVNIVENIYSKSTLGNLAVSAMVICICAFNLMTIDDVIMKVPFMSFFSMWTLQVFVLCYFSDLLIESSAQVSDAVYKSYWYNGSAAMAKDLLFVLTRAQKPCKLTAMGFTDLNLRVFTKICSSAWSYFALLQTIYGKK